MSIDNIIFEKEDTINETLTKVVLLHCGTTELKKELRKNGITNYSKVVRGAKVSYILRGRQIGRLVVTL
jgi:hypothetical protein